MNDMKVYILISLIILNLPTTHSLSKDMDLKWGFR